VLLPRKFLDKLHVSSAFELAEFNAPARTTASGGSIF